MLGSHASHCRKEAKLVEKTIIQHVHASGEGEKLCEKVRKYVFESSVDERLEMNERAAREGVPLINAIISSSTPGSTPTTIPPAAAPQFQKLIALYSTARDYDSLIEFSSSATFVKIIKDTLTVVLYGPLTQWSKKCNLSDRVQDLHVFLTDLVETARKKDVGECCLYGWDSENSVLTIEMESWSRSGSVFGALCETSTKVVLYVQRKPPRRAIHGRLPHISH